MFSLKNSEAMFSNQQSTGVKENKPNTNAAFFQPKLTINQPNDAYEQEADAMADRVIRMPGKKNGETFFKSPLSSIQRKCQHCGEEDKMLHRKETNSETIAASPHSENYIHSLNGTGRPLTTSERSFFEPRFGHDFSGVQLHTDAEANHSAKSLNALAYTHGNNIVFAKGEDNTNTDSGKKLMAHELTHVVQQGGATGRIQKQDAPDPNAPPPQRGPHLPDTGDFIPTIQWGPDGFTGCVPIPGSAQGSDPACISSNSLDTIRGWLRGRGVTTPIPNCAPGSVPNLLTNTCCAPGQIFDNMRMQCVTPSVRPLVIPSQPTVIQPPFGIPAAPPAQGLTGTFPAGTIDDFNINESGLNSRQTPAYQNLLSSLRLTLRNCPSTIINITGFTDAPGTPDYNEQLSQRRADTVRFRLMVDLLDPAQTTRPMIFARGEGPAHPVDPAAGQGYSARNRRVEAEVTLACPPVGSTLTPPSMLRPSPGLQ